MSSTTAPRRCYRFAVPGFLALCALVCVGVIGGLVYFLTGTPQVQPHQGDGQFANRSWRIPWTGFGIPVTGYSIEFPRFGLSDNYEASFRIEELPDLDKYAVVYLCIHDPSRTWWKDDRRKLLTGRFAFKLLDDHGRAVASVDRSLGGLIWAYPEGGRDCYGLYELDGSRFQPLPGKRYRLSVEYTADEQLSDFEGFVYIRCGGSI